MSQLTSVGIIPRTNYDFRELLGGTVKVPIAQRIDLAGASGLALELWVYEAQFGAKAAATLRVANDGYSPDNPDSSILQTKNTKGEDICVFVIDSKTVLPLYQTIRIPAEDIGRCLALILEARGGPDGGPYLSLSIDLLLRGTHEIEELLMEAGGVQPLITRPETEQGVAGSAIARIAAASSEAIAARPRRRYPRWREIVV